MLVINRPGYDTLSAACSEAKKLGVPALKIVPGVPVKMKVQGEHVSVQSTKHGKNPAAQGL
ncbi:hypothetical protein Taro_016354 [Colocasia esculenta]|uniref:Uncharacterized protein n=1 Tax=Colocasia esculenta TaxID=4460 RepID=A0A843UQ26_COLES|nr:hypothetical protein [Colocasia esculenta]